MGQQVLQDVLVAGLGCGPPDAAIIIATHGGRIRESVRVRVCACVGVCCVYVCGGGGCVGGWVRGEGGRGGGGARLGQPVSHSQARNIMEMSFLTMHGM